MVQTSCLSGRFAGDVRPGPAAVGALHHVRLVVAALPVVERDEDRVDVARRREDVGDVGPLRHAGKVFDLPPVLPAVIRDLQQPVVGAGVEQALEQRRLVDRDDVAERRRRGVERDRIARPHLAHDRDVEGVEVAREVRADARPRVAAIVGAIDVVARPVQPPRIVRADDVGRVPVDAIGGAAQPPAAASALRRLRRCGAWRSGGTCGARRQDLRQLRRDSPPAHLRGAAGAPASDRRGPARRRGPAPGRRPARPAARPASRRLHRRRVRRRPAAAGSTATRRCADRAARCRRSATRRRRCSDPRDRFSTGSRRRR